MEQIEQTLTSIEVAEMVGKDHKELLRDIRRYSEQMSKIAESNIALGEFFKESAYKDANNQERPCYLISKKGCEFISHKLTGAKGTEFTAKYINKFHEMKQVISNGLDGLSVEMQALIMHDKKIQAVICHTAENESRIGNLENNMNIDYAQQKQLRDFTGKVVKSALGGKESCAYRYKDESGKMASRVYSRLWHDFYDYFNINAYANLPRVRFKEALEYINKWQPSTNMQLEIGRINRM